MSPASAGRFPTNSAAWEAHTYNKFPLCCIPSHSENSVEFPVLKVKVAQSCPTLCDPVDYTVHGILQARIPEWAAVSFSKGSSQPRDRTQVSRIAGRFFTSWAIGKPVNTGVGSLSLLQAIFLTQESNRGLLHCRCIFYQPSYQGLYNRFSLVIYFIHSINSVYMSIPIF